MPRILACFKNPFTHFFANSYTLFRVELISIIPLFFTVTGY